MKILVERAALLDAVSKLQKVVGSKTSLPVLEGILLSAESGRLTLAAYNLEMGMKKEIYANCERAGDIVISARLFADILRRLGGVQVELEVDDKMMCHIRSGEAVFEIMGMAAVDFPEMPSVNEGYQVSVEASVLNDMVRGSIFAIAPLEGTRPILTGLHVSVHEGVLQLVAIDGYRLAIRREKVSIQDDFTFIVSGKAVNEAVKLIDEETETVNMTVGKRLMTFEINGYLFISRLLEGEFVNFEKLIPTEYIQRVFVSTKDFSDTVDRVSLLINDSFSTPVRFRFSEDLLVLSSATTMGRATENFPISLFGLPFEVGLNSRYLQEALRVCDSEKIQIRFNGPNVGVVILPADEENRDFLYLIMPMRMK